MNASEFKTGIKEIKENLKGLTLQLNNAYSTRPYKTLYEFGNAILNEEKKGNDFRINWVWTSAGILSVKSISHLSQLFSTEKITGVSFEAYYQSKDFSDYLRTGFSLND
ncbi:MAG: hypothetical protein V4580_13665 [Bacteroidota bacterium]